jgi:hypothetical protein
MVHLRVGIFLWGLIVHRRTHAPLLLAGIVTAAAATLHVQGCCDDCGPGPVCGNGKHEWREPCDDGDLNGTYGHCALNCSGPGPRCGDGIANGPESCDNGPANSDTLPDACRTDCTRPSCGDGIVDAGEECDGGAPGLAITASACRTDCKLAWCGDGVANGFEVCDGTSWGVWGGPACADFGFAGGTATCRGDCTPDLTGCNQVDICAATGRYGDTQCDACDALGGTEDPDCAAHCDADGVCADYFDPITGVFTCAHAGFAGSDPDCVCGDNLPEGPEWCDGTFLNAYTCGAFGFVEGTLRCQPNCLFDFSGCVAAVE